LVLAAKFRLKLGVHLADFGSVVVVFFRFGIFGVGNKKLPFTGLLEMTSVVCFVWVTAISNRRLRY
jgi:hypothetical protein